MRKFLICIPLFLFTASCLDAWVVRTLRVMGGAEIRRPTESEFTALKRGDEVPEGSIVRTETNSRVFLTPLAGVITIVQPESELIIEKVASPGISSAQAAKVDGADKPKQEAMLHLKKGHITSMVNDAGSETDYRIRFKSGVAAARGTVWDMNPDLVNVKEGEVIIFPLNDDGTIARDPYPALLAGEIGVFGSGGTFNSFDSLSDLASSVAVAASAQSSESQQSLIMLVQIVSEDAGDTGGIAQVTGGVIAATIASAVQGGGNVYEDITKTANAIIANVAGGEDTAVTNVGLASSGMVNSAIGSAGIFGLNLAETATAVGLGAKDAASLLSENSGIDEFVMLLTVTDNVQQVLRQAAQETGDKNLEFLSVGNSAGGDGDMFTLNSGDTIILGRDGVVGVVVPDMEITQDEFVKLAIAADVPPDEAEYVVSSQDGVVVLGGADGQEMPPDLPEILVLVVLSDLESVLMDDDPTYTGSPAGQGNTLQPVEEDFESPLENQQNETPVDVTEISPS